MVNSDTCCVSLATSGFSSLTPDSSSLFSLVSIISSSSPVPLSSTNWSKVLDISSGSASAA
nr:hypothetical protein [Clostridium botulinum]